MTTIFDPIKLADRGYVLENGHVVLEDSGSALLANSAYSWATALPRRPRKAF